MDTVNSNETSTVQRGVYPPSFCRWRLLLVVAAVTQVTVLLMGVGALREFSLTWLGILSMYSQVLALVTAMGLCLSRAWLGRLSSHGAWLGSWFVAVIMALAFSYTAGIIGTVLGAGPGREGFGMFVLQSVLAVGLVSMALFRYLFVRAHRVCN